MSDPHHLRVVVETPNGTRLWERHPTGGMTATPYRKDGTLAAIIAALEEALRQARGELGADDPATTERYSIPADSLADPQVAIAPEQVRVLDRAEYPVEEIETGLRRAGLLNPHTERAKAPSSPRQASEPSPSEGKA